jgi:uncharacterized protein
MREALETLLRAGQAPAVAVSGGVDSMTLAALAALLRPDALMIHAVSPAVPAQATARVRRVAQDRGWQLLVITAGEFEDPRYLANPVNRCFHCKTHLYGAIRARSQRPIFSGANLDDLREYRPGLEAARLHGVRHPYVEAGIDKNGVRRIARELDMHEVSELPASPCLSSRVETGIRIESRGLEFIDAVERMVAERLRPATVRCRIRAGAIVIELDEAALGALDERQRRHVLEGIALEPHRPDLLPIRFAPYRNGGAFLTGDRVT